MVVLVVGLHTMIVGIIEIPFFGVSFLWILGPFAKIPV
jgi:hypothetical protein